MSPGIHHVFLPALRTTAVTLLLTGLAYPLVTTGVAQLLFAARANGSLVRDEKDRVVGSELIGQAFTNDAYLWPRPSAAGEKGYDAAASGGSNLGPTSKALRDRVRNEAARLRERHPDAAGPVPAELVTTSASGLDPHLSPAAALWQVPRIARARHASEERVRAVIEANVEGRDLGIFGEPRVNVLPVNLALDRLLGRPALDTSASGSGASPAKPAPPSHASASGSGPSPAKPAPPLDASASGSGPSPAKPAPPSER